MAFRFVHAMQRYNGRLYRGAEIAPGAGGVLMAESEIMEAKKQIADLKEIVRIGTVSSVDKDKRTRVYGFSFRPPHAAGIYSLWPAPP